MADIVIIVIIILIIISGSSSSSGSSINSIRGSGIISGVIIRDVWVA